MDDKPPGPGRWLPVWLLAFLLSSVATAQGVETAHVSSGQIILLAVFLLLSAFMAGSETALTAMSRWKIRELREAGEDPTGVFARLESTPTRFITTLLIGNTLANIAASALVTQIALGLAAPLGFSASAAVAYATGVTTLLVLIFCEITPKSFAVHNAVALSRIVIRPVYFLSVVLYPIGLFFTFIAGNILRLFRLEPAHNPLITENELRLMLRSAEETGVIEAQEREMIKGVIDLEETAVREVMTPRVDIIAISEDAPLEQLLNLVSEHGYSRLPVYAGTVDNIRGIAYARDLLPYLTAPGLGSARAAEVMRAAQYVPETMSILNLLRDMRRRKNHLAVVVDEFGGTAGLITLEDIIEEITGEIYDETDLEEAAEIAPLGEGRFRIQAAAHLEEVGAELGLTFADEGDYDTLAGFLISEFDYIPSPGESLDYQDYCFKVAEADERHIISVLAAPLEQAPTAEEAEHGS
jgi:CBS domain containing-hemolysin-like protein